LPETAYTQTYNHLSLHISKNFVPQLGLGLVRQPLNVVQVIFSLRNHCFGDFVFSARVAESEVKCPTPTPNPSFQNFLTPTFPKFPNSTPTP